MANMLKSVIQNVGSEYLIRAEALNAIDTLLMDLNIDATDVFKELGLSIDLLLAKNHDENIPYTKFLELLNHCVVVTERNDFGALLAGFQDMDVIGVTGQAMKEAPTARVAIKNLVDFFHLHMNGLKVGFDEYQRESLITLHVVMPFSPDYRQQVELSLGIGMRFIRRLLGRLWKPEQAYLEHMEDADSSTINKLFGCPVRYQNEFNGFLIRNQDLDIPRADFNSQMHQILYDYLCLQTRSSKTNFVIDVRASIIQNLNLGRSGIEDICRSLNIQRRTLQRRLASSKMTYKALLEETRVDLAQRYLRTPGISITQISDMLCYSDPTGFTRAFRRCVGCGPRDWRYANHF